MIILYYPQNAPPGLGRLPMSLLALAAVLEGKEEYAIVDGNTDRHAFRTLMSLLQERPETIAVAISVMPGLQLVNAIRDSKRIHEQFPGVHIVWGGYFPSMHTESVLNTPYIDYVIRAQGERALPELIESLAGKKPIAEVHNASYRLEGAFRHNAEYPLYDPNDRPIFPYQRLPMDRYAIPTFIGERTLCHESSVGCPHKCNFCGVVDLFQSRWKAEEVDRTVSTLRVLQIQYGMNGVEFHDSDFFVSQKRVAQLSEEMLPLRLKWWGEGRIDTLLRYDRSTWKLMEKSGLKMIFFGAESGLNETLTLMDKGGVTIEQTKEIATLCGEFDVIPEFSFVMGANPERTEEDIDATIRLMYELERLNPRSRMHPFIYTPVPFGTIYDEAVKGGLVYPKNLDQWLDHEWKQYTLRQNPHTPWLTKRLYRKIVNFRAVHQSYAPKLNDRHLAAWRLRLLKILSSWRYRSRFFAGAYELRVLQRLLVTSAAHEGGL